MASFPLDMTTTSLSMPEPSASSMPYWRMGLSTSGSISFGMTFVAGKNRVPKPAQGKTQVRRVAMSRERIERFHHGDTEITEFSVCSVSPWFNGHGSDIAFVVVKLF